MRKVRIIVLGIAMLFGVVVHAGKSITVNLSTQTATAYENGAEVFSGRISTGTAKRPTPTGHFRVLEKDIDHVSNSWPKPNGGAKMHYMLRVTKYGIAMHLGYVPDYPASHGCIRMQNGFAQRMYSWARVGTPIRVIGHAPARVYRVASRKRIGKKKAQRSIQGRTVVRQSFGRVVAPKKHHAASRRSAAKMVRKSSTTKPLRSHRSYTLDLLNTSPKAVKRVKEAQREKWKNRPKRRHPRQNPLKVLRVS